MSTSNRMEGDHSRRRRIPLLAALAVAALATTGTGVRAAAPPAPALYFEHNEGQVDARAAFIARTAGPAAFLTGTGPWMNVRTADGGKMGVGIRFAGGAPAPCLQPGDALAGKVNYLRGSDPASWRTNIPTCSTVRHESVWPGIDVVYRGAGGRLEYDFVVRPGADASVIAMAFDGAESVSLERDGSVVVTAGGQEALVQRPPVAWQEIGGVRREVAVRHVRRGQLEVALAVGSYDATRELVIDPLVYSTYFGSAGQQYNKGFAVDPQGNAYITGTADDDWPTTPGAFQEEPLSTGFPNFNEAYVAKFGPTGALIYSTYLGTSTGSSGADVAADAAGNAIVLGKAHGGYPTTPGAYDTTYDEPTGSFEGFLTKLDPNGSNLVWSTYLGTGSGGFAYIEIDADGNAYVAGEGQCGFAVPSDSYDTTCSGAGDGLIAKFDAYGQYLLDATYLQAASQMKDIALSSGRDVFVSGYTTDPSFPTTPGAPDRTHGGGMDGFVAKLSADFRTLVYSTFLGGQGADSAEGITVDAGGAAYVTGSTDSADFPVTASAYQRRRNGTSGDAFVTKINAAGTAWVYSTYLGGKKRDGGGRIIVTATGLATLTGAAQSSDFPTTAGAYDRTFNGGLTDAFVTQLNAAGSALVYSTFLGGSGSDEQTALGFVTPTCVVVGGLTTSANFPLVNPADSTLAGTFDWFVTKLQF